MYIPKRYGQSAVNNCPFCGQQAVAKNRQDVPVCIKHKAAVLGEMKCACGSYLELKSGKYGVYFSCYRCGNRNLRKVLEMNTVVDVSGAVEAENREIKKETKKETVGGTNGLPAKTKPREITIRSDDPDYF